MMMAFASTAAAMCAANPDCDNYLPAHDNRRRRLSFDSEAFTNRYNILADISDVIAGDSLSTMSSIQQKLESIAVQTSVISEISPAAQTLTMSMVATLMGALAGTGESLPEPDRSRFWNGVRSILFPRRRWRTEHRPCAPALWWACSQLAQA